MNVRLTDKQKIKVSGSRSIYEIMQRILLSESKVDQEKEHLWLISLATNNLILNIELVSLGSVNATIARPMNVFRVAVMKGAVKAILCHNHPSGNVMPSEEDKDMTDRLYQVGRILNIEVIDHLIISTKSYLSFADTGLLAKIAESKEWVPAYEIEEEIRKEEAQIRALAVEEARLEEKLKGAEQLLEANKKAAKDGEKEKE